MHRTWDAWEGETIEHYTNNCKHLNDKVIPKHSKVSFSWISEQFESSHSAYIPQKLKCKIVFEPNKDDAIATYKSTGEEYIEYLEWKNSQKKK